MTLQSGSPFLFKEKASSFFYILNISINFLKRIFMNRNKTKEFRVVNGTLIPENNGCLVKYLEQHEFYIVSCTIIFRVRGHIFLYHKYQTCLELFSSPRCGFVFRITFPSQCGRKVPGLRIKIHHSARFYSFLYAVRLWQHKFPVIWVYLKIVLIFENLNWTFFHRSEQLEG